ncbi:DUF7344 domain-containing protein [Halobellus captivus]|uniref:DUF7344 domain-containing protein n=1 Tax=Halobellus captivus TaxID=2592614 RepID=UPI0011A88441|nr:hypothetical protein [Halobellus captivus]
MTEDPNKPTAIYLYEGQLSEDAIFDVLSNERRRECISFLVRQPVDREVSVRQIADTVAAAITDDGPPSQSLNQSVYVSFVQTHLPLLADHDIVDYEDSERSVSSGPNLRVVAAFLTVPESV